MSSKTKCSACSTLDLLVTNSVPSDFQTNEIHKAILHAKAEIFVLDDEIAGVQRALDRLELQRANLEDFVKAHRGVVSTVRRLPSEILGEIFTHYLDASDSRAHPPEALSHLLGVCNQWRAITLASPPLWCHIFPNIWGELSREMQKTSLQLQRSASAVLSIHLQAATLTYQMNAVNIMDLILTESRRWHSLFLAVHPSYHTHLATSRAQFPILEKLTLVLEDPSSEDTALFFRSLPALTDLTLQVDGTIPSTLDFIWAQLRVCTLHWCRRGDILRILPLFSAGTRLCLEKNVDAYLTSVHTVTVVSDLSLHSYGPEDIHPLLGAFTAPCLKRLSPTGFYSITSVPSFIDRSLCALTHLSIGWYDQFADEMLALLGSPHARHIVDFDVTLPDALMPRTLADALARHDIVPNLRTLAFRLCVRLDEAKVLEIHANRRPTLQSLWLDRPGLLSQDTVKALKSGGLEVILFD
ncbi:hypothetical protein GGX14DRAFT_700472 [Mycena pura]|uniref:F-box domain-containing protein n=1 Tax=Mycena pura TaxID=153505 RepID=A0AAD6UXG4_9AGAR|nr:hypothetical protein GGX14DRAFT_700472 [Mycena pura]